MASHQPGMRVRLLGRPSAQVGAEIIDFTPDKRYQLLGYLAYHREWISRDRAACLFWPDTSSALARQNLRGLVQRVRSLGGITGLETTTQHIRWRVDTDVDTLRQAIESGRPGEVITAYSGPLLSGLDDTAAPEYASWVSSERETLHTRWREAVFFRSEELTTQGRYQEAEDLLRRVMDVDPLDEEVLRRRLMTLSQGGQRETALRLYRRVAAGLAAGWGVEPSDATRQLVQDVESAGEVTERWAPTAPGVKGAFEGEARFLSETEGLFAGREVDLAEVQHLLTTPTCRLLTLVGPGGVGKTRLAWQAAWEQRRRGSRDVYVVPLEAVTSREAMTAHIAAVLGLQLEGGEDPLVQITRHLHARSVMLVLDNFEHLLAHVDVASALLAGCPGLTLLMTSRERLNVRHEWLYALDGLPCPLKTWSQQTC
ncbi:AAA family ATPase (plasmid) [Deinococcus taeanensis]|uniref:AfsR/SARP family transcriptional regulator n=1 Tax=Deinococcus taeanensis TaxID=2737050 RepID=UPI001CDB940D|nr:BTAD domain-containing putative transcriptional regulator [Deinococcus taeanensis]UBV45253.1 AAA family ATPase [Deinococcus taeanensis]